jgi:hypothetical protein
VKRYFSIVIESLKEWQIPLSCASLCKLRTTCAQVAAREQHPFQHPHFHYPGPDILVFRAPPAPNSNAHAMNAVVMSNGELDWNKPVMIYQ